MSDDGIIKWNKDRKAQRDEDLLAQKAFEYEQRAKKHVQSVFEQWRKATFAKLKKTKAEDRLAALEEAHADLRARVNNLLATSGLEQFRETSARLIDETIERVNAYLKIQAQRAEQHDSADIMRALPNIFTSLDGGEPVPFHSEEEFVDIPEVRKHIEDPDCQGLVVRFESKGVCILVGYLGGVKAKLMFRPVGYCHSSKGLGRFPTQREFESAVSGLN